MSEAPTLWLLAGGNGAGKSTFYRLVLEPLGLPFVNADIIARLLDPDTPEEASYLAATLAEHLRGEMLTARHCFCYETVFSHPSKVDFVALAKSHGYQVHLVYIELDAPALNAARVTQRVSEGGHNVPGNKIATRLPRTRRYVRDVLPLVDTALLLDNSSAIDPLREVAFLDKGAVDYPNGEPPGWVRELLADFL